MKLIMMLCLGALLTAPAQNSAQMPAEAVRIINAFKAQEEVEEKASQKRMESKLNETVVFLKQVYDREVQRGNEEGAVLVKKAVENLKSGRGQSLFDGSYKNVSNTKELIMYLEQTVWKGSMGGAEISWKFSDPGHGRCDVWGHDLQITVDTERRFTVNHPKGDWQIICLMNADGLGFVGVNRDDGTDVEMKLSSRTTAKKP